MASYKDTMLTAPDTIKATGEVNYNVDDSVIGATIRTSQNIYLRDVIGTALLEKIQQLVWEKIQGGTGTTIDSEEAAPYKVLLDEYIQPALGYKVAAELCTRLTYKLRNFGVVKNESTNINANDLADIIYVRDNMEVFWNDALNRMMEFICANVAAYPEANVKCGCGESPKFARSGLFLG